MKVALFQNPFAILRPVQLARRRVQYFRAAVQVTVPIHRGRILQPYHRTGPNLTNIPAQTQFPPQRLPANEIRVPYQSSAPSGREVVQCRGFGE